ncbi:MAG: two-component regulator propeller domain-containing protein, partial [Leeuwenhoekiella sp.]
MAYKEKYFLSAFVFILLNFSYCFSQNNTYPQYHFDALKNNITQRAVSSISQDRQGFIWMGTNGLGLNRYNGTDYAPYQYHEADSTSLSNSLVHTTYIDTHNRLWVGTETGIDLYNREQDNFTHIDLLKNSKFISISVQAILEDKNGDLLVGTHQYGIFKINAKTLLSNKIRITGLNEVENLLINSLALFDNRILAGTSRGVFELDEKRGLIKPLAFVTTKGKEKITAPIKTMAIDGKGSIWLGTTKQGLLKIDRNENGRYNIERFPITSKRILSLLSTPRNTILCGTENDGLFELNSKGKIINHYLNNKFNDNGVKSNSIWSLFLDNQERIWIGYYNNGVSVYDKFYDKFKDIESRPNYPNSLQSSSVTGIIQDETGRLWIGMDGGGIDVYNSKINVFTHLLNNKNTIATGLNSSDVQTLFKDNQGNIWVGTWDYGIYYLEKDSTQFINYSVENTSGEVASNRILSFAQDSQGTIWIGTFSGGIESFDPNLKKFTSYDQEPFRSKKISYSDVKKVYVDSDDNIWIGGNAGLFKLKRTNNKFNLVDLSSRFYKKDSKHTHKSLVIDIYEDSSKNIWIGTDVAGLCQYDMNEDSFAWVKAEKGFNKITVSSIIEDANGFIWTAGNNGLTKIDKDRNTIKNFSINDGLLTNDFNNAAYKDENGKLYFGSYEGINFFDPGDLPLNRNTPSIYLSDLKLFNQSVIPESKDSPLNKIVSQTKKVIFTHAQS